MTIQIFLKMYNVIIKCDIVVYKLIGAWKYIMKCFEENHIALAKDRTPAIKMVESYFYILRVLRLSYKIWR